MVNYVPMLHNYRSLVAKVDELCRGIRSEYGDFIICREGCAGCCRHISLFPVEAAALAVALHESSPGKSAHIRKLAGAASADACPLLENGRCLLYEYRPIICRTHGFPLLTSREGEKALDFCPNNFKGVASFTATAVLNLDLLNATLAAINAVFVASCDESTLLPKDRLSLAAALLLELHS